MSKSRVTYSETQTHVDYNTGEIKETEQTNVIRLPREPAYVKMYIEDLSKILDLSHCSRTLVYALLRQMNYEGIITLNASARQRIADYLKITEQTVRNKLTELCKKGVLKRLNRGEYEMNPHLFAKGDWVDIHKRREKFQLTIEYDGDKRTIKAKTI